MCEFYALAHSCLFVCGKYYMYIFFLDVQTGDIRLAPSVKVDIDVPMQYAVQTCMVLQPNAVTMATMTFPMKMLLRDASQNIGLGATSTSEPAGPMGRGNQVLPRPAETKKNRRNTNQVTLAPEVVLGLFWNGSGSK